MIRYTFDGEAEFQAQLKQIMREFPQETRQAVYNTAFVSVETYMKRNDIPVDTGRLRASIHTKSIQKEMHSYQDEDGNTFNGTLTTSINRDTVAVGTNVEYAELMNERGGGGENSRRTVGGAKRSKGYGKGFFDKAVRNGEIQLEKRLRKLINELGDSV